MKKIISFILAAMMFALSVSAASSVELPEVRIGDTFSDVAPGRWSYGSVSYAYEKGYMNGVGGDRFDPAGTMTRAMVVTVLWRREGAPDVAFSPVFKDVKDGTWYSSAVIWAKDAGVVLGTSETTFSPEGRITREQLVTMLCRYTEYKELDTSSKGSIAKYPDANKVSEWAKAAVIWAVERGLIKGNKKGDKDYLDPKGNATREQFAAILERYDGTDFSFPLAYNAPVPISKYTEKDYPLAKDADIFVAPNGDDGADGSLAHPLATFEGAVAAVRRLKETKTEGGIKVAFMAGEYPAPVGIEMTDADSGTAENPITYCKYGDGDVVFNAGVTLPADKFEDLDESEFGMFPEKSRDRVKKINIADYGIAPGELTSDNHVFRGTERLDSARWPNKRDNGNDDFINYYDSISEDEKSITLFRTTNNRVKKYHNVDDLYMMGYYEYDWKASEGPVLSYDPDTGFVTPTVNGRIHKTSDGGACPYFYFYNIPDELDRPDEYYVDKKTGYFYIMDPDEDYTISKTGQMFRMTDTDHVSFVGLEFCFNTSDFLRANDSDYITFDRCYFHNIRGWCIYIYGDHETVRDCEFYDIGMRCVDMCSGDRETLTHGESVIENNLFDHFGSVGKTGMAAIYVWGCGITIAHNEICNSSNIGIFYSEYIWGSNDILIEYNYIHNVVSQSSDSGAIYAGRNPAGHGSVVRYNIIADVGNPVEGHRPVGIYLDDSMAGQEIYGNIFYEIGNNSLFISNGRENKIHDNIVISKWEGDYKCELLYGNLHYTLAEERTEGFTVPYPDTEEIMILELVPYKSPVWAERFPLLAAITYDPADVCANIDDINNPINPAYAEVYGNVLIIPQERIDKGDAEKIEDRALELAARIEPSATYPVTENPFFVDPNKGDYRIDPEKSDIEIPYEQIGRY
ncbi:MAG: S-layer homology domain-containing protein [Clostridia bacterium]|nr:S-layer homology domain-containing protein [Clostridia bacterium]